MELFRDFRFELSRLLTEIHICLKLFRFSEMLTVKAIISFLKFEKEIMSRNILIWGIIWYPYWIYPGWFYTTTKSNVKNCMLKKGSLKCQLAMKFLFLFKEKSGDDFSLNKLNVSVWNWMKLINNVSYLFNADKLVQKIKLDS